MTTRCNLSRPRTVRARVTKGALKPLEKLDLLEGSEVTLTIVATPSGHNRAAFLRAAGGWKGLIDAKKLIRDIYKSRLVSPRPALNHKGPVPRRHGRAFFHA